MKIEILEISGLGPALTALRLPHGLDMRSEARFVCEWGDGGAAHFESATNIDIESKDLALMGKLIRGGDCEAKVLRGILVYVQIDAPVYWWCECETYRAGHERLCSESTMHIDCKKLSGDELVAAKEAILMGRVLRKVDYFSYQALRNIYIWRHNHRLPLWREFCDWIKTLPYANELILTGLEDIESPSEGAEMGEKSSKMPNESSDKVNSPEGVSKPAKRVLFNSRGK